jgi:hypothetical protein
MSLETKEVTLWKFIDDNHKSLSVLGVLFAVVGVFSKIGDGWGRTVSVYFYLLAMLVFIEVRKQFPKGITNLTFELFQALFNGAFIPITFWLFSNYGGEVKYILPILFLLIFLNQSSKTLASDKTLQGLHKRLGQRKHWRRLYLVAGMEIAVSLLVSGGLAYFSYLVLAAIFP